MLSDLLKLVIRGERPEGKVEVGGSQLQRFHLPHAKLHHQHSDHNSLRHKSKKFGRSSIQAALSSSSSASSTSSWGTRKSSSASSSKSSASPFSPYRRRSDSKPSKSSRKGGNDSRKKDSKDSRGSGKGRPDNRKGAGSHLGEQDFEEDVKVRCLLVANVFRAGVAGDSLSP